MRPRASAIDPKGHEDGRRVRPQRARRQIGRLGACPRRVRGRSLRSEAEGEPGCARDQKHRGEHRRRPDQLGQKPRLEIAGGGDSGGQQHRREIEELLPLEGQLIGRVPVDETDHSGGRDPSQEGAPQESARAESPQAPGGETAGDGD